MKIKNIETANDKLFRLAEIEKTLKEKEVLRDDVVAQAKKDFMDETASLDKEVETIVAELKEFTDNNRSKIIPEGKKSVDLSNGTLGYRQNPDAIEVSDKTAELLEQAGLTALVKVTKTPVKASLKNLSDDELIKFEAKRTPGQESFYAKTA